VLFRQQRVGEREKIFSMLKLRSMTIDTDPELHASYMAQFIRGSEEADSSADGQIYKIDDPRVTRVGKWLRKTSLDELPQLWNVLRGEMSLVGPRPPILYEVECYSDEDRKRLAVTPGITGLWQVSGRNKTTFRRMVELDLEYIQRRSVLLDLEILIRTIPVVLIHHDAR
jgi:lipopolysaccharide/colanic/teichoic acid biosynthesis glycosyltransferase